MWMVAFIPSRNSENSWRVKIIIFEKSENYSIVTKPYSVLLLGWDDKWGYMPSGNQPAVQEMWQPWVQFLVRKISWRRKWQPTPVLLPGKFHGQRSLTGDSPWGHKRAGHNLETK